LSLPALTKRRGYVPLNDVEQSIKIAELTRGVKHHALVCRRSLGSSHESEPDATLTRDEDRVSDKGASTDKHDETLMVSYIIDKLVWNGEEATAKWQDVR
jgi:hypothetical protein